MSYGIFKVFKYCFKDLDIKNQEIFRDLFFGLKRRRLRQGYGELYNLKVDDRDIEYDDIKNYLEFKDAIPVTSSNNFEDNFEKDKNFKKVSILIKNR